MSSYSLGKELTRIALQERAGLTLQDQVARLFLQARDAHERIATDLQDAVPQPQARLPIRGAVQPRV